MMTASRTLLALLLAVIVMPLLPLRPADAQECRAAAAPGVNWEGCNKMNLIIDRSNLEKARLKGVNFTYTDLSNGNFAGADVEKAALLRASLEGSNLKGANFSRVEGFRTIFNKVDASGASFASAELQRSTFSGATLVDVDFTKAELGRAQFDGAAVQGATFALANLARVDLSKAKFSGPVDFTSAFFFLTRIEGMDLTQARGLAQWQIDMACGDDKTKLPAGLAAPAGWPCAFQMD
jgi:uncharacterized protein YjbI with pentapeptide repeats